MHRVWLGLVAVPQLVGALEVKPLRDFTLAICDVAVRELVVTIALAFDMVGSMVVLQVHAEVALVCVRVEFETAREGQASRRPSRAPADHLEQPVGSCRAAALIIVRAAAPATAIVRANVFKLGLIDRMAWCHRANTSKSTEKPSLRSRWDVAVDETGDAREVSQRSSQREQRGRSERCGTSYVICGQEGRAPKKVRLRRVARSHTSGGARTEGTAGARGRPAERCGPWASL